MTKKLRSLKAIFVMTILFAGLFIVTPPAPSQAKLINLGLVNLGYEVFVDWNTTALEDQPFVPRGELARLEVDVTLTITKGGTLTGLVSDLALLMYSGMTTNVHLEITEKPKWANVSLKTNDIPFTIVGKLLKQEPVKQTIEMTISVDEDAPGFSQAPIKIEAKVENKDKLFIPSIVGIKRDFTLTFQPEYLPLVDAQVQGSQSKIGGPMDTIEFPIEVTNQGNELTKVTFKIKDLPKDWKAIITDWVNLEVGETKTVYLSIKPPRGFGYHDDGANIEIEVTPARAQDLNNVGKTETISVLVESRGFSLVGIEQILIPLIIIIAIAVFIFYYFKKWKPQK